MSLPLATTTITVKRAPDRSNIDPEDYDELEDFVTYRTGIRATLAPRQGTEATVNGTQTVVVDLQCDPVDLHNFDLVLDEATGQEYAVQWAINSPGIAGMLAHVDAGLTMRG